MQCSAALRASLSLEDKAQRAGQHGVGCRQHVRGPLRNQRALILQSRRGAKSNQEGQAHPEKAPGGGLGRLEVCTAVSRRTCQVGTKGWRRGQLDWCRWFFQWTEHQVGAYGEKPVYECSFLLKGERAGQQGLS